MRRARRSARSDRAVPATFERFVKGRRAVLANGVTLVAAETPGLHSATLAAFVRTGSRYESASVNGVSHFLEHLLFRGSEGYPDTLAMNGAVENAGGGLNAVTARDYSCFYTPIHPGFVEKGLDVLGDLIRRPLFRDVDLERQVILEEILDEVDASGRDVDPDNLVKRLAFGAHPLGFKIGGTRRTVRALREAHLRAHHARFYTGANVVVSTAGPFPFGAVLAAARRAFGAIPPGTAARARRAPRWPAGPLCTAVDHADAQAEFTLAFPGVPEHHPDFPAALCLRRILDDGLSSRLPYEIVERQGLAYSIHCGLEAYEDTGLFSVEGACSPGRLGPVIAEVLAVLGGVSASHAPEGEVALARRRHRMSLSFAADNPQELASWFGTGELLGWPEEMRERCRRVERVRPADVRRVARAAFRARNLVAAVVGPDARGLRRALFRAVEGSPLRR